MYQISRKGESSEGVVGDGPLETNWVLLPELRDIDGRPGTRYPVRSLSLQGVSLPYLGDEPVRV